MDPMQQFLKNHKHDPHEAVLALFVSFGYHLSTDKEAIHKIMDYANQEIERSL